MTINQNTVMGKWTEIKGDIQKSWGKLTNDELEKTKGDINAIKGLLQQRYGEAQEAFSQKVTDIFHKYEDKKDAAIKSIESNLKS